MAEYASQLLKRRESPEESEPEGESEEVPESAEEETVDEGDPLAEAMQEEAPDEPDPPAEETEPEQTQSKPTIDLDSLTEDETTALAKKLNASAVKRFGKLTAQKKTLAEQNLALQQQMQQQQTAANEAPAYLQENALSNAVTDEQLLKEAENLNSLMEWAEENLENEVQYDDEGNEYAAKDGDKVYTKADLRRIRNNARKIIRKDAPARQKWIEERMQSDQDAVQTFEFLSDPESDEYGLFMQAKSSPLYKPLVDYLPNSNFALALMVKGQAQVLKEREEAKSASKAPKKKPTAPIAATESAGAPKASKGKSSGKKALEAAQKRFQQSGEMADYQAYLRLKRSAA